MSMISFPADVPCEVTFVVSEVLPGEYSARGNLTNSRQGGLNQGWALARLGHAVEYLVDSRMFDFDAQNVRDEQEAVQILKRMSWAIFAECAEVMPGRTRTDRWVRVCGSGLAAPKWFGGKTA